MNDRPPRGTVTLDVNAPGREGPSDQVIENEIESQARGYSVRSGVAEKGGTKSRVREFGNIPFDQDL